MKRASPLLFLCLAVATGGCRRGPWSLWDAYSAHFINGDGRVVDFSANQRTTSEGQAYALFFALADNDRAHFDKLLGWTRDNLAGGDMSKHLPGWLWGEAPDGQWKLLDTNPASDADCWMAYTLVEAGRLWDSQAYTRLGRQMMAMIAKQEVTDLPGFGTMLMPGTLEQWVHNNSWTLNPSYVPMFLFERFDAADPSGPWGAIAMNVPRMLRQSARHGFAMDWVDYMPGEGFYPSLPPPAEPPKDPAKTAAKPANSSAQTNGSEQKGSAGSAPNPPDVQATEPKSPMGSYDAIRVYLWAGMMDGSGRTRADIVGSVAGMGAYLSSADHQLPPEKVSAQGIPEAKDGPVGFSAAVLPYLWANAEMARAAAKQRVRVSAELDATTGLYGKNPVYYDQNLVLFAMGYLDGRFHFGPGGEMKVDWTR